MNFGACLALVSLGVLGLVGGVCELWWFYFFTFVLAVVSCVWGLLYGALRFDSWFAPCFGGGWCSAVLLSGFL